MNRVPRAILLRMSLTLSFAFWLVQWSDELDSARHPLRRSECVACRADDDMMLDSNGFGPGEIFDRKSIPPSSEQLQ